MLDGSEALDRLGRVPGGSRLLTVLAQRPEARIVGGAVRDLALGREPQEVDVVTAGDAAALAAQIGRVVAEHERFLTFQVDCDGLRVDVARARAERYERPGALPDVRPSDLDSDLSRRDFTINALMLSPSGGLTGAPHALDDLRAGRLRVMHGRSFEDDPTRLWRLVRYAVRLGFLPETGTGELAAAAVAVGALETVSAERLGAELRLALSEPDPLAVLHAAANLGLVDDLSLDPRLVERTLEILGGHGRRELAILGACVRRAGWGERFALTPAECRIIDRSVLLEPLAEVGASHASTLIETLDREPPEAIAVAGARGHAPTARRWLDEWAQLRPSIGGDELIAAGLVPGPEIGRLLALTRAALLDGRIPPGVESELRFALAAAG